MPDEVEDVYIHQALVTKTIYAIRIFSLSLTMGFVDDSQQII